MYKRQLFLWAAGLEAGSEHPLAQAILDAASQRGLELPTVDRFEAVAGQGATGHLAGQALLVGNRRLLESHGIDTAPLQAGIAQSAAAGQTPVLIAVNGHPAEMCIRDRC